MLPALAVLDLLPHAHPSRVRAILVLYREEVPPRVSKKFAALSVRLCVQRVRNPCYSSVFALLPFREDAQRRSGHSREDFVSCQ